MKTDKEIFQMHVNTSLRRIFDLYTDTGGACYLAFSGGKDSQVVLSLIKMAQELTLVPKNSFPAVFTDTRIELDATVRFVNWVKENYYPNTEIIHPETTFPRILKAFGKPMISKMKSSELNDLYYQRKRGDADKYHTFDRLLGRTYIGVNGKAIGSNHRLVIGDKHMQVLHPDFPIIPSDECCHQLKKLPFKVYGDEHGMLGYLTGERMAEGGVRAFRAEKALESGGNVCTRMKDGRIVKSPIIDWPDQVLEDYIEEYKVPLSDAYTVYGMWRTGCFVCPFDQNIEFRMKVLHEYEPRKYRYSLATMKDVYIAQGVKLEFDEEYMKEFHEAWRGDLRRMQLEMLREHRPCGRLRKRLEKEEATNAC